METKSELLDLLSKMDVHPVITEIVQESDDEDGFDNAIADLEYLREEIGRVMRQIELSNS